MKFSVTMKDPDTLNDAIADAIASLHVDGLEDLKTSMAIFVFTIRIT